MYRNFTGEQQVSLTLKKDKLPYFWALKSYFYQKIKNGLSR